jgi:hypothetical protein
MNKVLLTCLAVLATASIPMVAPARCVLTSIVPQDGKFELGKTIVSLGEPDSKNQPAAWLGPLRSGQCSFDIGIIEQPIALTPSGDLYVATYSGSERSIALYNLKTCSIRWQSAAFAGKLELDSRELRLDAEKIMLDDACLPRKASYRQQR